MVVVNHPNTIYCIGVGHQYILGGTPIYPIYHNIQKCFSPAAGFCFGGKRYYIPQYTQIYIIYPNIYWGTPQYTQYPIYTPIYCIVLGYTPQYTQYIVLYWVQPCIIYTYYISINILCPRFFWASVETGSSTRALDPIFLH